jgi:tetratricopeptide (TPR) repeat protein
LNSGRIALDGPELLAYVGALLADYVPDRDVGFFYMLVAGHGGSLDLNTRMLCACLMAQSVPNPRALQAAHSYSVHFSIVIEEFARTHAVSPLDPAGILRLALSDTGWRHQIHAPLARFLAQPAQADVTCAALTTLLGNLRELDPGLWLRLVRPLSAAARWHDALAALSSVHAAHPRDPQVCQELAVILCRSGHVEEAVRTMKQAVELEPRHPYVLANAANLMLEAGALVDAAAFAQRAADIEPNVAAFRDILLTARQAMAQQTSAPPQ